MASRRWAWRSGGAEGVVVGVEQQLCVRGLLAFATASAPGDPASTRCSGMRAERLEAAGRPGGATHAPAAAAAAVLGRRPHRSARSHAVTSKGFDLQNEPLTSGRM